jgi:hypothetical protein
MSESIEDSAEYRHLLAHGIPQDAAWNAVWIDRAYNHLVRNGMSGSVAYAQAVAIYAANGLDIGAMTPEAFMHTVLEQWYKAQQKFPSLDPQPAAAGGFVYARASSERASEPIVTRSWYNGRAVAC